MHAVFLDQQTFSHSTSFEAINAQVTRFLTYATTSAEDVVNRCIDTDIVITNKVIFSAEVLKQLPQLKLICIAATGTNNIDLEAAKT